MERKYFLVESEEANKLVREMNEHNNRCYQVAKELQEEVGAS